MYNQAETICITELKYTRSNYSFTKIMINLREFRKVVQEQEKQYSTIPVQDLNNICNT